MAGVARCAPRPRPTYSPGLPRLRRAEADGTVVDGNAMVSQLLSLFRQRVVAARPIGSSTRQRYFGALAALDAELGTVRLRRLDVVTVERALDRIATGCQGRGQPLTRATLSRIRQTLVAALDFGVRRKMLAYNPAAMAELTPTAAASRSRRALTPEEARKLWAALEGERLGNLVRLMLTTGLRPGEALGLCWDSVDFDAGALTVRRAVRLHGGKARLVDDLKNDASFRTIGLPGTAVEVLRAQRRSVAEIKLAANTWPVEDPELVFPTVNGTPWNLANVRHELEAICLAAGIDPIRPHELRHTAASVLSDQGVPLEHIADLLGHVDVTMVSRTYRHRLRPSVDAAVDVMDRVFGG